jgi:hypothetical protein
VSFASISVCVASQPVFYCSKRMFVYRLSPETFGYTIVLTYLRIFKFRWRDALPHNFTLFTAMMPHGYKPYT